MLERAPRYVPFAAAAVAFLVYAATAARGVTWWDGSSYPLAAVTLGVPGAPGSLLLVLLGWVVTKIPIVFPVAFRLNLFAGALAATLVGIVAWLGARLATPEGRAPGSLESLAGAIAGLTLAFGVTPWTYAVQFTPYVLSALWTALLLVAALAWWRRPGASNGRGRLFLVFLLLGLDLSVHRTNLLLLPAVLLWFAIRTPASDSRWRDGLAGAAGLILGIAFHLLLIPMAARRPAYLVEDPSSLARWWSYVTVERVGGGFLVNLFPRRADFLTIQLADLVGFLRRNLSPAAYLPAALAVLGWFLILRHHPRRALGMLGFFLCAGLGAVVYFNRPATYMRSLDRHYLPALVIASPWIAVGAAAMLTYARRRAGVIAAALVGLALAGIPLGAWVANHRACDLSRWQFAEGFARDLLEPLPERAILLTNGDNDSFPLWYLQQAEGVRPDVTVINLPSSNLWSCVDQIRRTVPGLSGLLEGESGEGVLAVETSADAAVTTVVEPRVNLGLPAGMTPPDSITFRAPAPRLGEDRVVLDLFRLTRWRRPVHLACTVTPDHVPWLWPFARIDGLAFRIIPSEDPKVADIDHLRSQLFERMRYAALADTSAPLDPDSRILCRNYAAALLQLVAAQAGRGQAREALASLRFLDERVSPARLGMDVSQYAPLRARLEAEAGRQAAP